MGIPKEGDDGIHAVGIFDGEAIKIPADAHERYYVCYSSMTYNL